MNCDLHGILYVLPIIVVRNQSQIDTYSQVVSLSYESLFPFANVINACRNRPPEVDCSYPPELFTEPPQLLQTWESSVGVLT